MLRFKIGHYRKFSIPSNSAGIVDALQGISDAGHRARVTYYKGFIAWPWKGNTTYYATDVKDLGSPGVAPLVVTPTAQ